MRRSVFDRVTDGVEGYKMVGRDIVGALHLLDMALWTLNRSTDRIHPELVENGDAFDESIAEFLHTLERDIASTVRSLRWVANSLDLEGRGDPIEARNALLRALRNRGMVHWAPTGTYDNSSEIAPRPVRRPSPLDPTD